MEKLRVGIIGCGGIANGKHMPALRSQADKADMVAFCDIVVERAEKAAKEFGAPGAKVYENYRELLEDGSIDVVHVCTPNRSHCEITVAALEAGKHVMCEKPMAKTAADAQKMLDAARKTGKKLTIGYQNRCRPDSLLMKKAVDAGALGDIYFAKAHALDLTLWMMDNYKPKAVLGSTFKKLGNQTETGNAWGDWDPKEFTVEDSAFGFVTMENGATIILESSWALNTLDVREAQTTLCGTLGGADMADGLRFNKVEWGKQCVQKPDLSGGGVAFYDGASSGDPAEVECAQWLNAVLNDKTPLVLPEQALVVTQILEAIYTSAKTGKAVYFE